MPDLWDDMDLVVAETFLSRGPEKSSATAGIIFVLILLIFSGMYWNNTFGWSDQLPGNHRAVFQGHQYWRLITGFLVHADFQHLLSNSLGFTLLTALVYGYYGLPCCLLLVFGGGALINLVALWTYPPDIVLTGASGVVYLLAAFWLTLYVCIERRHRLPHRIMRGIGFSLIMLFPTAFSPEVSYRAHAIGFALGVPAAVLYFLYRKEYFRRFEIFEEA